MQLIAVSFFTVCRAPAATNLAHPARELTHIMPACTKLNDDFAEKLQDANCLSRADYLSVVWTYDAIRGAFNFAMRLMEAFPLGELFSAHVCRSVMRTYNGLISGMESTEHLGACFCAHCWATLPRATLVSVSPL